MIFYKFDAHALTIVGAAIATRECALAGCRFQFNVTDKCFANHLQRHYQTGDDEHRVALNEYLNKKVLSYQ